MVSHKYVTPDLIKNLEEEIAVCKSSIDRIQIISRGGAEGMKELSSQVRDFMQVATDKKNLALDRMMQTGGGNLVDPKIQADSALICRGQEKAFEVVLDMIENPKRAIEYYEKQKQEYEAELMRYKLMEQRKQA